jgi:uncharacterized YccA/Bax inhibitor family protein
MNIRRSSNPVLTKTVFSNAREKTGEGVMTVNGTVNKIFLMLLLVVLGAGYTWNLLGTGNTSAMQTYMLIGGIGGFITAIVTVFKMTWSPITAPIYSVLQGLFLGGISAYFNSKFPGIVTNAVALTFGTLFAMLAIYRSGLIKVTNKFRLGVVAATGGIAIAYFLSFILNMFGVNVGFMHSTGTIGIIISLVIIVVAALNLVLDFDFIERGAEAGAPKFMEWYGAFGLMVTLIWLYIEFLRLLAIFSSRD